MALGLKEKNINYIKAYRHRNRSTNINKTSSWAITSLLILILLFALSYAYLIYLTNNLNNELNTYNSFINDQNNIKLYNQAVEKENSDAASLFSQKQELIKAKDARKKLPILNKIDYESFLACRGTEITLSDFSFSNSSSFSFTANAAFTDDITKYIEKLKNIGLFEDIRYNGYKYIENTGYNFDLTCILKVVD